jgi:transketolase
MVALRRFVNVGVAEQNMTGMAAGLAMCGKIVLTYSIANFPVMRCLEQIRNDVCCHALNVKIVAVGGGLAYGSAGYTHHGVEDLAVMRVLPNMTVLAPADPLETRLATSAILQHSGPCYLRLGKAREPMVHSATPVFRLGRAIRVRDGRDITLITTGAVLDLAIECADALATEGIEACVMSMHTVQPVDVEALRWAAVHTAGIVTVEEHGRGGLSAAVLEALADAQIMPRFSAVNLASSPVAFAGSQASLRARLGVSLQRVFEAAKMVVLGHAPRPV